MTPTTYTVSSLADSGDGSLRAAITSVNGDSTPDEIDFSVAGVIKLTSGALPAITNTVKIDGTTAPGFAGAPVVEVDASNYSSGLVFEAAQCTLQALGIVANDGDGTCVKLDGNNETVIGNYIGFAVNGGVPTGQGGTGISVVKSMNDVIGGTSAVDRNVISGNSDAGILLNESAQFVQNATIEGNYIGTDPTGQSALGNQIGIRIFTSGNTVGGTQPGAGNVIANNLVGIDIEGSSDNAILGNSIYNNGQGIGSGGNQNTPAPLLAFASQTGTTAKVNGTVNAAANTPYSIQIYVTPTQQNGFQGQFYLGTLSTTSNANGLASFTFNAQVPSNAGTNFTALATSPSNNTSTFSASVTLSTSTSEAFVSSAYGLLLNRSADVFSPVWVNRLNAGVPAPEVLAEIQASPEYLGDQVTVMYERYLKRAPDIGGAEYWLNFLEAGGTFEQVAEGLTSSQEYFALNGGTNQGFITALYQDVFNRTPSTAELAGWESYLDAGNSRASVSVAFFVSQEYRTDLVESDFETFLLRLADAAGLAAWVNALNAGATDQQVLAQIFGSSEGYQLWS